MDKKYADTTIDKHYLSGTKEIKLVKNENNLQIIEKVIGNNISDVLIYRTSSPKNIQVQFHIQSFIILLTYRVYSLKFS